MKPEGRKIINFPNKKDCHPRKGYVNWWENIRDYISRKTRKQKTAADINKIGQLNDWIEGGNERFCGSCNWSCCNFDCVDTHSIDKDRWCHKYNKSVWTLKDASNCEEYFD